MTQTYQIKLIQARTNSLKVKWENIGWFINIHAIKNWARGSHQRNVHSTWQNNPIDDVEALKYEKLFYSP